METQSSNPNHDNVVALLDIGVVIMYKFFTDQQDGENALGQIKAKVRSLYTKTALQSSEIEEKLTELENAFSPQEEDADDFFIPADRRHLKQFVQRTQEQKNAAGRRRLKRPEDYADEIRRFVDLGFKPGYIQCKLGLPQESLVRFIRNLKEGDQS